ncbi:MAG: homogentisate 1,2-dioxygenase [Fidelibacterota bacterium]
MAYYLQRGSIPPKRHTQFRKPDDSLYREEHISRGGFSGVYSNVYHIHPPTRVQAVKEFQALSREVWDKPYRHHHFRTGQLKSEGDPIESRRILLFNDDVTVLKAHTTESMSRFYRNAHADEVIFVHRGSGNFVSHLGTLPFKKGDYIVVPRGVIWQMNLDEPCRFLVFETSGPVEPPLRYRNPQGQLKEGAPYCERDIRVPDFQEPRDDEGKFEVLVKVKEGIQTYVYNNHPCDVVGWDGYYYPWIFNIWDFEPITGRIHQPPPVHQTFEAPGLVICSFVPRMFDTDPQAIPAPYSHSNVDSDEMIYYVEGHFMSRKGMEEESISFHPPGPPHGPQPGKTEESIGKKETTEMAIMMDTFRPLNVGIACKDIDDPDYPTSWI